MPDDDEEKRVFTKETRIKEILQKIIEENGVTKEDLKELILHSSLYAGLPAANAAMHMAEEVFKELGIEVNPIAAKEQD